MNAEKLELLEKWHMTIALMGIEYSEVFDDYDDGSLYDLLQLEEQRADRLANPSDLMKAVLQTVEMGVTTDDIDEYDSHLDEVRQAKEQQEKIERERNNPEIKRLYEDFSFEFTAPKRYASHKHFRFKDANGIEYHARIFNPSWGHTRIWLYWKTAKGKKQFRWDARTSQLQVPKAFPYDWQQWGYTSELNKIAHVIAYWVTARKMPKDSGFVYPKK